MNGRNLYARLLVAGVCGILLAGCSSIAERTNVLSDDDIRSKTAGTLGYSVNNVTLINRRTDGTNTFAVVRTNDKKEFSCTINGGNLLSMGMTNPPTCIPKK